MASEKVETVIAGNYVEMEREEGDSSKPPKSKLSTLFWHGGSVYDAWFSCASNQVAQVLLTLPYSFSQLGMLSGILFQLFYGLMGSWTAYLISVLYVEYRTRKEREKVDFRNHVIQWFEVLDGLLGKHWRNVGLFFNCTFLLFGSVIQLIACASNIYYINDNLDKRTWTYIFGACCATTVFIPSFHNYRIWSFLGLMMTTPPSNSLKKQASGFHFHFQESFFLEKTMASKATSSLAFLLSLNLLFFSLVTACNDCYVPPKPKPPCPPPAKPSPKPSPSSGYGTCPRDTLKLGVCAKLLGGLVDITIGKPPVTPCCTLVEGLADLEAAVCLCTAIKASVLGNNLNIPVSLSLLLNVCKRNAPKDFQC